MADNPLLGAWKLVSCHAIRNHGTFVPIYGKHPVGMLYYDAAGNMCVQIMKAGRAACSAETKYGASDQEMKTAYEGYEAYFSRYKVDLQAGTITHQVEGSLFPNWTGTTQVRYFRFLAPDRILMSTTPLDAQPNGGTSLRLVWERLGAN